MRTDADRLPHGFPVRLAATTHVDRHGRLLGGSPTRLATLTETATQLLRTGIVPATDPTSRRLCEWLLDTGLGEPAFDDDTCATRSVLPAVAAQDLTVVVPVRDRPTELARLLTGLPAGATRVIVVDDGSTDAMEIAEVAGRHGAEVVRHPVGQGPAAARNTGLSQVRTPFVAFVDSDVRCTHADLLQLSRHFADLRVALVGPRVQEWSEQPGRWLARYQRVRSALDMGPRPGLVRAATRVGWMPSACLVARVNALPAMGFDATLQLGEDVDLCWRLDDSGWLVRYDPSVSVSHRARVDLISWLGRRVAYGSSTAALAARHGPYTAPAVVNPWVVLVGVSLWLPAPYLLGGMAVSAAGVAVTMAVRGSPAAGPHLVARLTWQALASSLSQHTALLGRHYWPLALVAGLVSRRARGRMVLLTGIAIGVDYLRRRPDLDPIRYGFARILDDVAHGGGLCMGAATARSSRALLPTTSARLRRRRHTVRAHLR